MFLFQQAEHAASVCSGGGKQLSGCSCEGTNSHLSTHTHRDRGIKQAHRAPGSDSTALLSPGLHYRLHREEK